MHRKKHVDNYFLYCHMPYVVLLGLPDKRLGEQVCAAIKIRKGNSLTEQEVKEFCNGNVRIIFTILACSRHDVSKAGI